MAGDDQARRHFDDARALPHPAQRVVAQGHRLEAAFLPREPDQHPGVHGWGTVQRYRSATGMLSAVMTRHRRQPLGRGGAGPQSQVAHRQAGVLHNHSCRMDVHSIRQLGVGSVLATPTPRRSLGRPSRSTAAKAAPRQNHESSVCLRGSWSEWQSSSPRSADLENPAKSLRKPRKPLVPTVRNSAAGSRARPTRTNAPGRKLHDRLQLDGPSKMRQFVPIG